MELLRVAQIFNIYPTSKVQECELLKEVDVNYRIPDTLPGTQTMRKIWAGYTSLHFAVKRDDLNLINELLERDADPAVQGARDGRTPLHLAIKGTSVYQLSGQLQTYSLIDTLLSRQVEINNALNPKCEDGVSHLHIACIVNNADAVEFFAKAKVTLDDSTNSDFYSLPGYTPLHCAIHYSSMEAAKILLQHGADINIKNAKGVSCLHYLIERMMDMADFIMIGKRTLSTPYEGEITRLESIIKLVLQARANNGIFVDGSGLSAVHIACILRDTSVLEMFLKNDFDVNMPVTNESKFWSGWTPTHFAASFNVKTMILLMHKGANIMIKNSKGETALDLCAKRFTTADVQLILSTKNEFKDISLSDNCTTLSDLLVAMNDLNKFSDFLQKLRDVNIILPMNSPIWSGYNLLHLSVSFNDRTKRKQFSDRKFDSPEKLEAINKPHYNCTEDEEVLYIKRIELLLENGVSVSTKNAKEQTPIHLAFGMHRKATVEKLLSHSDDNVDDQNGLSHLHIACAVGHSDAVKRYLSQGVDVNNQLRTGFDWLTEDPINARANSTLLHIAVAFGRKSIVKYLLEINADVYARDSLGLTPIHLTMTTRPTSESIAKLLFKGTPNLRDCVSSGGLSHLHVAAWAGDREAVDKLLLDGAQVDRVIEGNVEGCPFLASPAGTPLFMASDETVESLLMAGANVHAKDSDGISALQHALRLFDQTETTYFTDVVRQGNCDVESCGMTTLHVACGDCDIEWARELLNKGADVNARISDEKHDLHGATPLYVLLGEARLGFNNQHLVTFVEMLVDAGADATIDCRGVTPIHMMYDVLYAYAAVDEDFVESEFFRRSGDILLKSLQSYDINPVNSHGFSHFHFACIRNDVDVATKFLDHGVDVNETIDPLGDRDNDMKDQIGGFTPLHFSMAYHSREVAFLLLDRGANVNAEDVNGNKPLHVALKRDFVDLPLIETMFNLGADIHATNLNDESLLYCLLKGDFVTLKILELFLNNGCLRDIMDMVDKSHEGIMGLAMRAVGSSEFQRMLEILIQMDEMKNAMRSGFNFIESIVAIDHTGELELDDYLDAIQFLINNGCDIDQQDADGATALHAAVSFDNLEAINALLLLGADINVTDKRNACPFSDMIDVDYDEPREMEIVRVLASHVWKMRLTGLELTQSNLRCLEKVEDQVSLIMWIKHPCESELSFAKETEIFEGLTVGDFLSERGAIAQYPRMGCVRRAIVDNYFTNPINLRYDFSEFRGVLAFQYRKALARMELWESAKEVLLLICQFELPDLCLEAILRYFTNNEMKLFIELAKELV